MAHPSRLRTYLPHSLAATFLVISVPLIILSVISQVLSLEISPGETMFLTLGLSFVGAAVASHVWDRRLPEAELSFGELMIWSWYRLQKAERRLVIGQHAVRADRPPEEQLQVLHELSDALESKDPYTRGHSKRVERHSFKIGVALGLPLKDVDVLRAAASVHDVGKIRVPNKILHKPGALSDEERALIEQHPVLGSEMAANTGNEVIVETVRHHHERWDGRGYPDGIAGPDIPLFARIVAVADSYDAITSTRAYRVGGSRKKATAILVGESEKQFDPDVVDAFMTTLPARSPLVAALMFVPGPGAIWRHLRRFLARFGSARMAPILGAMSASVVLGASPMPFPGGPAQEQARVELATVSLGPLTTVSPDRTHVKPSAFDARASRKSAEDARRERRKVDREQAGASSTGRTKRERNGPVLAAGAPTADASTSSPSTAVSAQKGQVVAAPAAPTASPASHLSSVDDPNAQGKDCKPGLGKSSKGSNLHCG